MNTPSPGGRDYLLLLVMAVSFHNSIDHSCEDVIFL